MKVNVEVDLSWLEDGETIDEAIVYRIADKFIDQDRIGELIKKAIAERFDDSIDSVLTKTLDSFMDREVAITDNWGTVQERHENVEELLKARFDSFMSELVDSNGKK
jgi:hypothetical protein